MLHSKCYPMFFRWAEGHSLLMMDNIFEELEFFDKNNISDEDFEELGK